MIYLLYGTDKHRLNNRITEIIQAAGIHVGDANYSEMGSEINIPLLISEAKAIPFLAEKRVLRINNFLTDKKKDGIEKLVEWLPNCPDETEIIFVEEEAPDQRLLITKTLQKNAKVENFIPLNPAEMIKFIEKRVKERGGNIDRSAANSLQLYVGSDLTRVNNEIDKLLSYSQDITKNNVDLLVDAGFFNTIFDFTDAISSRNQGRALSLLDKLFESGENENYLLSMIVMQIRNLLLVSDLYGHRLNETEITSRTKLHPYVVKKTLSMVKNFNISDLIRMHRELLSIEEDIKTSAKDPQLLLVNFVTKATEK